MLVVKLLAIFVKLVPQAKLMLVPTLYVILTGMSFVIIIIVKCTPAPPDRTTYFSPTFQGYFLILHVIENLLILQGGQVK